MTTPIAAVKNNDKVKVPKKLAGQSLVEVFQVVNEFMLSINSLTSNMHVELLQKGLQKSSS